MVEQILSAVCLLVIVAGAWLSRREPLFVSAANALSASLAAFIALRYWWLAANLIGSRLSLPPAELSFGVFWLLFGVSYTVFLRLRDIPEEGNVPEYPNLFQQVFGFLFAAVPVAALLCAVMTSILILLPEAWPDYDRSKMIVPWDRLLIDGYQRVETGVFKMAADAPAHTRFPKANPPRIATHEPLWE